MPDLGKQLFYLLPVLFAQRRTAALLNWKGFTKASGSGKSRVISGSARRALRPKKSLVRKMRLFRICCPPSKPETAFSNPIRLFWDDIRIFEEAPWGAGGCPVGGNVFLILSVSVIFLCETPRAVGVPPLSTRKISLRLYQRLSRRDGRLTTTPCRRNRINL
jgi:hypothetical protein